MTVDEAKTKWCPMVRMSETVEDRNASNCTVCRSRNPQFARCIGPECAVWRLYTYNGAAGGSGECGLTDPWRSGQ